MIHYEAGQWGVGFILALRGSVFPRAVVWALPNACMGALMSIAFNHEWIARSKTTDWVQVWSGYAFVLGFLLVFRTSNAYARFWEGASSVQQVRGEWYNAISSVIAFSSRDPQKEYEVRRFQQCLIRLMSMLYCSALYQMSTDLADDFQVLNVQGIEPASLDYLATKEDKSEVILQWIQRHVVDGMNSGVVSVPAPIVSRVFQELSRGIVTVQDCIKISEFIFPFPYAQMCSIMLLIYWFVTPVMCASLLESWWWSAMLSGLSTLMLWSLYYIALEIEMPFGQGDNHLPLIAMQDDMNNSLWTMLEPQSQICPTFNYNPELHHDFHIAIPFWLNSNLSMPSRSLRRRSSMEKRNNAIGQRLFFHHDEKQHGGAESTARPSTDAAHSHGHKRRSRSKVAHREQAPRHLEDPGLSWTMDSNRTEATKISQFCATPNGAILAPPTPTSQESHSDHSSQNCAGVSQVVKSPEVVHPLPGAHIETARPPPPPCSGGVPADSTELARSSGLLSSSMAFGREHTFGNRSPPLDTVSTASGDASALRASAASTGLLGAAHAEHFTARPPDGSCPVPGMMGQLRVPPRHQQHPKCIVSSTDTTLE
mmetsp:Transcript_59661/g.141962  ORF Transcript_59661/g.141962 Transcript_59661/m.141962 type:complete len:596 (-) Transcript_59661:54-1841(-)